MDNLSLLEGSKLPAGAAFSTALGMCPWSFWRPMPWAWAVEIKAGTDWDKNRDNEIRNIFISGFLFGSLEINKKSNILNPHISLRLMFGILTQN
jgi:hypothetical protein